MDGISAVLEYNFDDNFFNNFEMEIDRRIELAKLACERLDSETPIMDKMRMWVYYNNLLHMRVKQLLTK